MQARGLHASTIRNDLSEMSAIWKVGIRNGKLPADPNPFAGRSSPKAGRTSRSVRPYSDDEAAQVLLAAQEASGFIRWLPWVACLMGARITELCPSVRADVGESKGMPTIGLHDEGDGRTIPLHPALVAQGFLRYIAALPAGSTLFPDLQLDRTFRPRGVTASKRVGRWIRRLGITDPAQLLLAPLVRGRLPGRDDA